MDLNQSQPLPLSSFSFLVLLSSSQEVAPSSSFLALRACQLPLPQWEQSFLCPPSRNLHLLHCSISFLHSLVKWSLLQLNHLLLSLQAASMSMAFRSLVLAHSAIPVFIELRSCFLLPVYFRSFLRIDH